MVLKGQSRIDWAEDRKNVSEEIALCHVKVHFTFSKAKTKGTSQAIFFVMTWIESIKLCTCKFYNYSAIGHENTPKYEENPITYVHF